MPEKPASIFNSQVARLYELDRQIETLKAERALTAKELIDLGEGQYVDGAGRKALVIVPTTYTTSYTLYPAKALAAFLEGKKVKKATPALLEEFREAQEEAARKYTGDQFKALFDRSVIHEPTKGFADLVPKLLTTAKARDTLLLCQVVKPPSDPYVKLPDKPKAASAEED